MVEASVRIDGSESDYAYAVAGLPQVMPVPLAPVLMVETLPNVSG